MRPLICTCTSLCVKQQAPVSMFIFEHACGRSPGYRIFPSHSVCSCDHTLVVTFTRLAQHWKLLAALGSVLHFQLQYMICCSSHLSAGLFCVPSPARISFAGKPPQRLHSLVGQGRRSQCRLWIEEKSFREREHK